MYNIVNTRQSPDSVFFHSSLFCINLLLFVIGMVFLHSYYSFSFFHSYCMISKLSEPTTKPWFCFSCLQTSNSKSTCKSVLRKGRSCSEPQSVSLKELQNKEVKLPERNYQNEVKSKNTRGKFCVSLSNGSFLKSDGSSQCSGKGLSCPKRIKESNFKEARGIQDKLLASEDETKIESVSEIKTGRLQTENVTVFPFDLNEVPVEESVLEMTAENRKQKMVPGASDAKSMNDCAHDPDSVTKCVALNLDLNLLPSSDDD